MLNQHQVHIRDKVKETKIDIHNDPTPVIRNWEECGSFFFKFFIKQFSFRFNLNKGIGSFKVKSGLNMTQNNLEIYLKSFHMRAIF